ncbi:MAG TPA: hypothetical protein VMV72_04655 [Verrucomicrobiae bacterium]|nr:hypothetical protein [Verrucomicrobiae bacterium]
MPPNSRKRALDAVTNKQPWKSYNELFRSHTKIYDDVFDRGSAPDLECYVDFRTNEGAVFADILVENMLGLQQPGREEGRVYILRGDVGRGKSIFSRHLVQKFVPDKHPKVVAAYCDAFDIVQCKDFSEFQTNLRDSIVRAAMDSRPDMFPSECAFFRLLLESKTKGYSLTDGEIIDRRDKFTVEETLDFLASQQSVVRVLVVVDNLDECSKVTIDLALSFVRNLTQRGGTAPRSQKVSVLLPLRGYTVNRYGDTKRFACLDLPEPNYTGVFGRKLEMLRNLIAKDANVYEGIVSPSVFPRSRHEKSIQVIRYQVSPQGAYKFLKDLADYLLVAKQERDFAPLLKGICAGNCKYLVADLYNFLHSCKLPLTPLFGQVFLPEHTRDMRQVVPTGIAVECLMAIHYPFFDVDDSLICNVFNAANQSAPNSFENTLVMPRVLARLVNAGQPMQVSRLQQEFKTTGYHHSCVDAAFKKLAKFGLITSSEGHDTETWTAETLISGNSATRTYLEVLLVEPSYLQYVCEDTPMPESYMVSVEDKYGGKLIGSGSKGARLQSVNKFLQFIEEEERLEKEAVIGKRLVERTFLNRFGVRVDDSYLWLSRHMRAGVEYRLQKASNGA